VDKTKEFGVRLKVLRLQAGMMQRELAGLVNIDFTYLSKIENGVMPPPSDKVILQLAKALHADSDELITLAGRIPADIVEILRDREALQMLRSGRDQKKFRAQAKKGERVHRSENFKNLPEAIKAHKSFARVASAAILTILVSTLLLFASPTTSTAVALNNQGVVYNEAGEYQKAIATFDRAVELDPGLALTYNNRGWAYIELGQYEQGITDCNKAIELDPGLALAYSNRGWAYIELGQYEQTIADCNKAIELDLGLALAYNNRGLAYMELGQYEKAIADFDKAIELDPNLLK